MEEEVYEIYTDESESKEFDMYTEEGLESYSDDDAINPYEQAFMVGYLEG